MDIRILTDEEADALWACGAELYHTFAPHRSMGDRVWYTHDIKLSPKHDRDTYNEDSRWVFGARVE